MTETRAADDFATIRARLDELRRERAQVSAGQEGRSSISTRSDHRAVSSVAAQAGRRLLLRSIYRRSLIGYSSFRPSGRS